MHSHTKLSFLAALLCSTTTQAVDGIDLFELTLAELATIEIATKHTQNIYSSPSSVSTISRIQLQNLGIVDLQTLLNFVPGFQSTRDIEQGTANRISARGRSTALSESVLVQIDGNKINDLYTGGISIINRLLTLGNVDRVEIIRGPGSALYGGNAFLGVINIITASNLSEVSFSADDLGSITSQLFYQNHAKTVDLYLSAFNDKGDNYQFTDLYGVNTPTKDPIDGHDLYVKYQTSQWKVTGRHMQRKLQNFLPLGSLGNNINEEKTTQWSISGDYNYALSADSQVKFTAHYSQDKWDTVALLIPKDVEIAPEFSLTDNFVGGPYLTSHSLKMSGELTSQIKDNHFLTLGVIWERAEIDEVYTSTTHNLSTLEPYDSSIKLEGEDSFNVLKARNVTSLFIQDQVKLSEQWELTAGLRFDDYDDFGDTTNPRMAFVWKPNQTSSVKFLYGSAFRAPNFLELYDKNNYVDFGNVNLSAEEVETYELGWINTEESWHWEITLFHNKFSQLIELGDPVFHRENPFYAPQFMNRNDRKSQGFETELRLKLSSDLTLQSNYTWFDDNADITVSRQAATVMLNYQMNDLNLNFSAYYRGKSILVDKQKSYWVSRFNMRYQYSEKVTLAVKAENVFDQNFSTPAILYAEGVPNRGRVLSFTLAYQY